MAVILQHHEETLVVNRVGDQRVCLGASTDS